MLKIGDRFRTSEGFMQPNAIITEIRHIPYQQATDVTVLAERIPQTAQDIMFPLSMENVENWDVAQLEQWLFRQQ